MIRTTVKVLSFDDPVLLNSIFPVVALRSLQEILMLAAGDARTPLRLTLTTPVAVWVEVATLSMTVVPSHSLQLNTELAASFSVTVPLANQVPDVPCAVLGPSK